ncbi:hypothetical protein Bca4012_005988 [Brassica carinata]|uniref:Protein kinase domain-containing protein n=2 Tax=Brassica TaxID=3705 RepID=A0A3P6BEM2_BRAOL|nr:unnamed protein product [Brassica napus]VDC96310.1 unnamed protein product [Brassica oleracea]
MESFMAEWSLKDIRHRNLVKLLTACSSLDFQGNEFRALVYEFMPNGSLDIWLHPEKAEAIHRPSRTLTLLERLNIAIDVVSVLDYLHVHSHLLQKFDQESILIELSSAGVRGTIEYGLGRQPSIHGDVYSFVLEMFTRKRPTNELFGGNISLHSYTKSALPELKEYWTLQTNR